MLRLCVYIKPSAYCPSRQLRKGPYHSHPPSVPNIPDLRSLMTVANSVFTHTFIPSHNIAFHHLSGPALPGFCVSAVKWRSACASGSPNQFPADLAYRTGETREMIGVRASACRQLAPTCHPQPYCGKSWAQGLTHVLIDSLDACAHCVTSELPDARADSCEGCDREVAF